jgi:predicted HTH transcriptional regulator
MSTKDNSANQEASLPRGNRFALVVGVNNSSMVPSYRSTLRYAEKDAEDIAYFLKQPECNFSVLASLTGKKAITGDIKQGVMDLVRKRTEQDFLLFYFAGHAVPINSDIYFVTYDFQEDNVEVDSEFYLSMRWLWKVLYQSVGAGKILLILDCCYSGNMVEAKDDPLKIDLRRLLEEWDTGSSGKDQKNCLRLILTATGYDIQAQEVDGHGLMTGLLLKALRGEEEDALDNEGDVDIGMLHRYLQNKMPDEQQPDLSGKFGPSKCILASYPHKSERLRQQAKNKELEKGILAEFLGLYTQTQHTEPFDHSVCHSASSANLDSEKVTEFSKQKRVQNEKAFRPNISDQDQLIEFGLLQESYITYGTLLCFGQNPSKWISGAITRCIEWDGNDRSKGWRDSQFYRGGLLRQYELISDFLRKRLRLKRTINSEGSTEEWEIPSRVLDEALANALVHREYADATNFVHRTDFVLVEVFDDRVEISSPGTLPPPMTLDLLEKEHKSHPRNPQIAGIFYLFNYIEEVGSGIKRMQYLMKEAGLPEPEFKLGEDNTFIVILYRPSTRQEISPAQLSQQKEQKKNIFIGYSHKDIKYLDQLRIHLARYVREGLVDLWDDTIIKPGANWREEIQKALDHTRVAILLVSADFLASDFIAENILPPLLRTAETEGAIILPVIVNYCVVEDSPLQQFHLFNDPSNPLANQRAGDRNKMWTELVREVIRLENNA